MYLVKFHKVYLFSFHRIQLNFFQRSPKMFFFVFSKPLATGTIGNWTPSIVTQRALHSEGEGLMKAPKKDILSGSIEMFFFIPASLQGAVIFGWSSHGKEGMKSGKFLFH